MLRSSQVAARKPKASVADHQAGIYSSSPASAGQNKRRRHTSINGLPYGHVAIAHLPSLNPTVPAIPESIVPTHGYVSATPPHVSIRCRQFYHSHPSPPPQLNHTYLHFPSTILRQAIPMFKLLFSRNCFVDESNGNYVHASLGSFQGRKVAAI